MRGLPIALVMMLGVLTAGCDDMPERTSWVLASEPVGTTLEILVEAGACHPVNSVNVTETNESVTISAYTRRNDEGDCPGIALNVPRSVELRDPLGDRELRGCRIVADEECAETLGMR